MARSTVAALVSLLVCACHTGHAPPGGSAGPCGSAGADPCSGASVVQHHRSATRDGLYVDPAFTPAGAAGLQASAGFSATVDGAVYAQPLYVEGADGGVDALLVATETNQVSALDAATGAPLWQRSVAPPVPLTSLPCGDIGPTVGVTGTPVIDLAGRTIYLDTFSSPDSGATHRHLVQALSLDDGSSRPGWPVDVGAQVPGFDARVQNQRAALLLAGDRLLVAFSGHYGDCGDYHGWLISIPTGAPQAAVGWHTRAAAGGIWGPGGPSGDASGVFVATGNTMGVSTWGDGEAILRFDPAASPLGPADSFTPSNWKQLDDTDSDLGGSGALLVTVPGAAPSALAVALGKDGHAWLLDRAHLGGVGGQLSTAQVANSVIVNAAAAFTAASGTYLVFHALGASGTGCPGDLAAVRLTATAPPRPQGVWCAAQHGAGSPMVTTTDGSAHPLVWSVGSEGDNRLRAFDGETGAVVFAGGGAAEAMGEIKRFQTPIAARGHVYVAGVGRVYSFTVSR